MSRGDWVGAIAAAFLGAVIVVGGSLLWVAVDRAVRADRAHEECVAAVPTYLDGQEQAYMEQECRNG